MRSATCGSVYSEAPTTWTRQAARGYDHQVARKVHTASSEGSERARDLVDLQLLDKGEDLDFPQVRGTCVRLFDCRRQQTWPPSIVAGEQWDTLYAQAAEGPDVLPTVEEGQRLRAANNSYRLPSGRRVWQISARTTSRDRRRSTRSNAIA